MLEINNIYNEDCLEGMKKIDDKSVDFIFTDLPFSTTQNSWDVLIPFEPSPADRAREARTECARYRP